MTFDLNLYHVLVHLFIGNTGVHSVYITGNTQYIYLLLTVNPENRLDRCILIFRMKDQTETRQLYICLILQIVI